MSHPAAASRGQRVSNRCEEAALELAALLVEPGGDSLADGASSFLRAAVRLPLGQALDKSRKRRARVADETERGEGGADPFLVGIDLDELPAELEPVLLGRLGAELRADDEHRIGLLDEVAESGFVAGRAGGELVILGEGAFAHVRRHDRRAQSLGDGTQLVPGARAQDTASGPDERSLGAREDPRRFVQSSRVGHDRGGRATVEPIHLHVGLAREHVHRDFEEDRPARRRARALPGLGEELGHVLGAACPRGPLRDRLEGRALVAQLVQVATPAADEVAGNLARDRDERDMGARGFHQPRQ